MTQTVSGKQVSLPAEETFQEFGRRLRGHTLRPGDGDYEIARKVYNGMVDRYPAVIVRCAGVADVIEAVKFARDNALAVAVRGGGHSVPGYGVCDGGVVIDVSAMKELWVDPSERKARAGAGLTWGEFDQQTQAFGLAVTGGRVSSTGISGLTLGSGSGWLERRLGLTCDNLLSADLVTGDGQLVRANETENADLFWGLRGGGGNFGIVTSFEYRLHQIGPTVLGGMLLYPRSQARDILRFYRDYMGTAPDELGSGFAFITAPPEPELPEHIRGAPAIGIIVLYTGEMEAGDELVGKLRKFAPPAVDMVHPMPYTAVQSMLDASFPSGLQNYWKAEFMRELSDSAIEIMIEHANKIVSPFTSLLLEPLGGAFGQVSNDMLLGNRTATFCYHALCLWQDPAEADTHISWAREFAKAMQPFSMPGVYLNFTSDQVEEERVQSSFGDKYQRLVALKDKYDPTNFFKLNQNIRPSGDGHRGNLHD